MNTIGSIIANERLHRLPREDEYVNETDGFIYCSKCRTPRQTKTELSGKLLTVPVMCKYMSEARAKEDAERKERERLEHIARLRSAGLRDTALRI